MKTFHIQGTQRAGPLFDYRIPSMSQRDQRSCYRTLKTRKRLLNDRTSFSMVDSLSQRTTKPDFNRTQFTFSVPSITPSYQDHSFYEDAHYSQEAWATPPRPRVPMPPNLTPTMARSQYGGKRRHDDFEHEAPTISKKVQRR